MLEQKRPLTIYCIVSARWPNLCKFSPSISIHVIELIWLAVKTINYRKLSDSHTTKIVSSLWMQQFITLRLFYFTNIRIKAFDPHAPNAKCNLNLRRKKKNLPEFDGFAIAAHGSTWTAAFTASTGIFNAIDQIFIIASLVAFWATRRLCALIASIEAKTRCA